jgi:HSP20 family molecular chaperone IbpA
MFDKKCAKCKGKVKKNFEFCPYCGNEFSSSFDKEDFGILGKNDFIDEQFSPGLGNTLIDKMFNQTMKMLEKQMKNLAEETNNQNHQKIRANNANPNLNIQFFVNGKKVFPQQPNMQEMQNPVPQKVKVNKMSQEKLQMFSKLKKVEPNSNVKRFGNKIIYELNVPGVNNIEDILINRLENSIEIKALAKDKSYSKIINVNLPIIRYGLDNGNLILELQGK